MRTKKWPKVVRVERHRLGPRIRVLGVRLHEWQLGLAVLVALAAGIAVGIVHDTFPAVLAAASGVWLLAKDWRDLVPRHRDTAAWRLGLHRPPLPLRQLSKAEPLPLLAGGAAGAIGLINLFSALTPNIRWRGHLLRNIEGVSELRVFHALAVPASIALLVCAYYLYRRRLRALQLAVLLLLALGILNLFKGLDFEEALGDLGVAALLWLGRSSFHVQHEPLSRRAAVTRIPLVVAGGLLVSLAVTWIASPGSASLATVVRETGDLLLWQTGPLSFRDDVGRLDLAIGLIGLAIIGISTYLIFRPLAAPRALPDAGVRAAAIDLVRAHGSDTLAYFKLRRDKQYLFGGDGRAFLGYRIAGGVLLVSGEPVGPPDSIPDLLKRLASLAERSGLRIAAVGVSERFRPTFEQMGLRAFYIGDEAIVEISHFSLEGRPIRKVRQSVARLKKAGYEAELVHVADLDEATAGELDRVSTSWLGGSAERGFSMALEALRKEDHGDTIAVFARDERGRIRGFLHFVPAYGTRAMSLSLMRRDRQTPNGLTEFMVVRSIELLGATGVEEISLNFAAFARLLHSPTGRLQRLLGRAITIGDAYFQIERLYRFNAKFFPRWESRYLMYEGALNFPRVALATLWAEGQLPKPRLPGSITKRKVPPA